jgi:hypothetical protein
LHDKDWISWNGFYDEIVHNGLVYRRNFEEEKARGVEMWWEIVRM